MIIWVCVLWILNHITKIYTPYRIILGTPYYTYIVSATSQYDQWPVNINQYYLFSIFKKNAHLVSWSVFFNEKSRPSRKCYVIHENVYENFVRDAKTLPVLIFGASYSKEKIGNLKKKDRVSLLATYFLYQFR